MHADRYQAVLSSSDSIEAAGIFDDDTARGTAAAERYGVPYYDDLQRFLESGLDGVIICSENDRHYHDALAAFQAGTAVLCEKPIATRLEDARAMVEAAGELYSLAEQGEFGELISLVGMNRGKNPGGWFVERDRSGGGSLIDHIVHQLDFARWVFNIEPYRVYAESDTFFSDIDTEDAGLVLVEFDGGVTLTIDASWSRPSGFPTWGDNVVEVNGSRSSAIVDTQAGRVVRYEEPAVTFVPYHNRISRDMILDFCSDREGGDTIGADGGDGENDYTSQVRKEGDEYGR